MRRPHWTRCPNILWAFAPVGIPDISGRQWGIHLQDDGRVSTQVDRQSAYLCPGRGTLQEPCWNGTTVATIRLPQVMVASSFQSHRCLACAHNPARESHRWFGSVHRAGRHRQEPCLVGLSSSRLLDLMQRLRQFATLIGTAFALFRTYNDAGARPMQWPSLASKVIDTMQRCACW